MSQVQAVIFDMDGLLIDSEAIYLRSWEKVLSEHDFPMQLSDVYQTIGMTSEASARFYLSLLKDLRLVEKARFLREEAFWHILKTEGMPIKAGVNEVFEHLRINHIPMALATSTTKEKALTVLGYANIDPSIFDVMVFGDMIERSKPNPDIFLYTQKHLNVHRENCVIFEDSYNGVLAANRADIKAIWVKDLIDLSIYEDLKFYRTYDRIDQALGEIL